MASKQIVFITGANTGLGLEVVKALYKTSTPYEIIIGCRRVENGENAIASVKKEIASSPSSLSTVQTDVTSDESIQKAFDHISSTFGKIDVLINNAGANFDNQLQDGKMSLREASNKSWDTNVTGTHILTQTFMSILLKSSDPRLLFITSGTSSLNETERFDTVPMARINASPDAGWPKEKQVNPITLYRSSKTGLNMLMREYFRIMKNDGVKVWCISPGFLATGLGDFKTGELKKMGARDPSEGGNFIKDVVQGKHDSDTGKVIRVNAQQPW